MTKEHANWSPYDNNGGTCVAIAGADYCVIAADTRMSTGYSILTRDYSKICKLADKSFMASSGFQADVKALQKVLSSRHLIYQHQHNKQMSCPAMAQLLSNTLYYKRFFPYYAFNVLGGLDSEGKGCVFTYDAVGSYERVGYSAQGSGATLITPFLDNQLKSPSPLLLPAKVGIEFCLIELLTKVFKDAVTPLSEAEAVDLVKTCFSSATERDIYTGDSVEIIILNANGVRRESEQLRKD
ncbi:Proteasome subunit beta type-1 [Helianthus annuus]|nr:Proteasome subunit beta type-1 [Helianthus annuus]